MCYPKPGPRCYNHAVQDYQKALLSGDPAKTAAALGELERTPTAISAMRRAGEHDRANKAEVDRQFQLSLLRQDQKRQVVFGEMRRIKQASDPLASPESLDALVDDESVYVRRAVASNPSTSSESLERLLEDEDDEVLYEEVARNHNTSPEVLAKMFLDRGKTNVDPETGQFVVLQNPSFDTTAINDVLDRDVSNSHYIPALFASHPNSDDQCLRRTYGLLTGKNIGDDLSGTSEVVASLGLSDETHSRALESIASHPNLSLSTREYLRDYEDNPLVLRGLASNPAAKPQELEALYQQHGDRPEVKTGLLKNEHTPNEIIGEVTRGMVTQEGRGGVPNETLRAAAANPRVSKEVLYALLNEADCDAEIGANPAWSSDELRQISEVSIVETRDSPRLDHSKNSLLMGGVLKNPNTPADVVEHVARSDFYVFQEAVARSPRLTPTAADVLIHKGRVGLQVDTLRNPSLNSEYLADVLSKGRPDDGTLLGIANNPNASRQTLKQLMKSVHEGGYPNTVLADALGSNPALPSYRKLALSRSLVR